MPLIRVSAAELAQTIRIWLTVIGQRRPSLIRDLWTRRGDEHDAEKIAIARRELSRALAESLETAKWQVWRHEVRSDPVAMDRERAAVPRCTPAEDRPDGDEADADRP